MKRYCKNIDISDRNFIKKAILECLNGKGKKNKFSRRDTIRMFSEYSNLPTRFLFYISKTKQYHMFNGIIDTITEGVRFEILNKSYQWKEIWYSQKLEGKKIRTIGIQDIKQQLYDYIAVNGLHELFDKKIGRYQCAAIPSRGQVMGKKAIEKWIRNKNVKYGWKGDAKKYYENINTKILKKLLVRYVKNPPLLNLTFSLIDSFKSGLSIGSYLSQYLANFYMSFLYHFLSESEEMFKTRKHKNGKHKKIKLINHVLIYMDDIFITSGNLKYLKMAVKKLKTFAAKYLDVFIKDEDSWINFSDKNGYVDIMGFLISKSKTIVRPSTFRRYRKSIKKALKRKRITRKQAYQIISRWGWLSNADCKRFAKKNKSYFINKICKKVISSDKNVVFFSTGSDKSYSFA